ncbi:MAG TPA: hypothetical protein VJR69_06220 [Nitrospira sp.]|nr:hypothetical protein [Nitrospira sp.]
MSMASSFICRCLSRLAGLVLLPDVIGIRTPRLALQEILLLAVSVAKVIGGTALPIRPLTVFRTC